MKLSYDDRLARDIIDLLNTQPFWGHVLQNIHRVFDPYMGYAAAIEITRHTVMRIHPIEYFQYPLNTRIGILMHEILHVVCKHPIRMRHFKNKLKAQAAAEIAVNSHIEAPHLPNWFVTAELYNFPPGLTMNQYYDMIEEPEREEEDESIFQYDVDEPMLSQLSEIDNWGMKTDIDSDIVRLPRQDNPYIPFGFDIFDGHAWSKVEQDTAAENLVQEMLIDDILRRAMRRGGDIPSSIQKLIQFHEEAIVPWPQVLKRFIGSSRTVLSYTKKRTSKRYGYRPGIKFNRQGTIVVIVDSSGSISDKQLDAFLSEVRLARKLKLSEIWCIVCDTKVQRVIKPTESLNIAMGRGGTKFEPGIAWAISNTEGHPPLDGIIYLTDGYGTAPESAPPIPILWVITPSGTKPVDYGSLLTLPEGFELPYAKGLNS